MKTPIYDFVNRYIEKNVSRLHMPGHKGTNILGCENRDITEIGGADSLYEARGIIAKSEANATRIFGSKKTLYSAEGSSQCIKAMVYLALKNKDKNTKRVILATRNSHKAFIYACALLDIKVVWLFDSEENYSLCKCNISTDVIQKAIKKYKPFAVFVTSPDYLGGMLDIKGFCSVTHKFGIPLLVDNAHGAYLHFLKEGMHPMDLGADICCDSAHKTLPVLTGGAYLHIGNETYAEDAKTALEIFGSTSPSYLILQSLDLVNKYLTEGYCKKLENCIEKVNKLKLNLIKNGWEVTESDPLKLTVVSSGKNLSKILRKKEIETEYEDPDYTVFMFTPENKKEDFLKIEKALGKNKGESEFKRLILEKPEEKMSLRKALFSKNEIIPVEKAQGRILSSPTVSCPPAVSVVVSGEIISKNAIEIFKHYGIDEISVVK